MQQTPAHIGNYDPKDQSIVKMLGGVTELLNGVQEQYAECAAEKQYFRLQAEAAQVAAQNVVADGMQNELIAIFNALYARGMFTCSKKELMQRMADALGCPKLADYSTQLHKIKLANKYEDIFSDLERAALEERDKND